jgi:hypothetical protein
MSSDKLNLQLFSWTLAQGYSWLELFALLVLQPEGTSEEDRVIPNVCRKQLSDAQH